MIVDKISLKNYRSYDNVKIKFHDGVNIITGDNAQGKTNILESIYFLSITKSYRTSDDSFLIKLGKESSKIIAKVKKNGVPKKLDISINKKNKILAINGTIIKKISDFIGNVNVIIMSPEDVEIIKGSPSERRNLLNIELSKLSRNYIIKYNEYSKLLKMRNDYLKLLMTSGIADFRYLDIITEKLIDRAVYIYTERKKILDDLNSIMPNIYEDITGIGGLSISYMPNVEFEVFDSELIRKKLKHQYYKYKQREISLGMTIYGPHRDDFKFIINDEDMKLFASQGQQKLAVISLKLALVQIFKNRTDDMPILLLDDIFSELDRKKKNKLINYINSYGQVIITTNDIKDINKNKLTNIKIFEIKHKNIIEKGDVNEKRK